MNRYVKDAFYGLLGGIAGTYVIGKTMGAIQKLQAEEDKNREQQLIPEPPPEKLARRISENVLGLALEDEKKAVMGTTIQWTYGIVWGGIYGLLRNRVPGI